ncbi:RepA [Sporobolus striate mosaic virus 2]|uniref:Replication-associated protein n=1 Tax=Sporobolus striate mosaic virus 2 TaxID=1302850 RepID=J7FGY7_9GEMI|nr:RepA [Sporobolus striate mosaic virus 2]AFN80719.1 RepA [Sporobolus striate mosaic virus 2]
MSSQSNSTEASPANFRFRARSAFLTYPKCTLEPRDVVEHLYSKFRKYGPKYCLVTREHHSDGDYHLHCLFQLDKAFSTNDSSTFNILDYHPNIQTAKSPTNVRDYCLKNPVSKAERGTFIPLKGRTPKNTESKAKDSVMRSIINTSTDRASYLSMVRKAFPFDWATKLQQFEYSASKLFPDVIPEYTSPFPTENLMCNERITDWLDNTLYQVSPAAYSSLHPQADASGDLNWLMDASLQTIQELGNLGSTSADQIVPVRHLGPGV